VQAVVRSLLAARSTSLLPDAAVWLRDGNSGVTVSSYGSGAKPTVATVGVGSWRPNTANFANDITIMNLNVAGNVTQSIGLRVLFYRNTLSSTNPNDAGLYFGAIGYWANDDPFRVVPKAAFQHAREIFVVENNISSTTSGGLIGMYGDGANVAILGNSLGSFQQHNIRIVKTYRSIVAHNELRGVSADGSRHALKIHAGGLAPYDPSYAVSGDAWATRDLVLTRPGHRPFPGTASLSHPNHLLGPDMARSCYISCYKRRVT
jgi:hypothetical protein